MCGDFGWVIEYNLQNDLVLVEIGACEVKLKFFLIQFRLNEPRDIEHLLCYRCDYRILLSGVVLRGYA